MEKEVNEFSSTPSSPHKQNASSINPFGQQKSELKTEHWKVIQKELLDRHLLLQEAHRRLKEIDSDNALTLAATDIFVERAQEHLTSRAVSILIFGGLLSIALIVGLGYLSYYLIHIDVSNVTRGYHFTLRLVQSISATGVSLAAAYFLAGLARACLHEGTALFHRRHALRFGRLYVYVSRKNISFAELSDAFQWHRGAETAFRDLRPDALNQTLFHKIIEIVPDIILRKIGKPERSTGVAPAKPKNSGAKKLKPKTEESSGQVV